MLVASLGATTALWIDAASFLLSAALVAFFVPRPHAVRETDTRSRFFTRSWRRMRFIRDQRLTRALVAMVLLTNLVEAPAVVLTVFAEEEYGSARALGVMLGVLGGTALAGALVYGAVGHRLPRRRRS